MKNFGIKFYTTILSVASIRATNSLVFEIDTMLHYNIPETIYWLCYIAAAFVAVVVAPKVLEFDYAMTNKIINIIENMNTNTKKSHLKKVRS